MNPDQIAVAVIENRKAAAPDKPLHNIDLHTMIVDGIERALAQERRLYEPAVRDARGYLAMQEQIEGEKPGLQQTKHLAWNSRRLARVLRSILDNREQS